MNQRDGAKGMRMTRTRATVVATICSMLAAVLLMMAIMLGWPTNRAEPSHASSQPSEWSTDRTPRVPSALQLAPSLLRETSSGSQPQDSIDDEIVALQTLLESNDYKATINGLIRLGSMLRADTDGVVSSAVAHWMTTSRNPRLVCILSCALGAYAEYPEGLLASLVGAACIPDSFVHSLLATATLTRIPEEWGVQREQALWDDYFTAEPSILPGPLEALKSRTQVSSLGGMDLPLPNKTLKLMPRDRVADPAVIAALFRRVLLAGEAGARILRVSRRSIAVSDERVGAQVAVLLATDLTPRVKQELESWVRQASRGAARTELFRLFSVESDPIRRGLVGSALVTGDTAAAPSTFRGLWTQETDEVVQLALIHALGSLQTDTSLSELARLQPTGSPAVKTAVANEIVATYKVEHSELAKHLLLQFGVPIPPPATFPRPDPEK